MKDSTRDPDAGGAGEGRSVPGTVHGPGAGAATVPRARDASVRDLASEESYRWVYVWHLPIRISHWIAVGAIVLLAVTGFYIGRPWFSMGGEAASPFVMGWMRFLHFTGAALLVAMAILRIYWLFFGNRYERWRSLFPVEPKDWHNTFRMIRAYTLVRPEDAPRYLGHNPLQQMNYTLIYAVGLVEIITGFGMYGLSDTGGFFFKAFGWVGPLLGGWQMVRLLHHALMWVFIVFLPLHIYLVVRAAVLERGGELSSILTGGRYVRDDLEFEDD
jgi:Ni/Fe-hydrogenase 1 B-type cytochrome subunit